MIIRYTFPIIVTLLHMVSPLQTEDPVIDRIVAYQVRAEETQVLLQRAEDEQDLNKALLLLRMAAEQGVGKPKGIALYRLGQQSLYQLLSDDTPIIDTHSNMFTASADTASSSSSISQSPTSSPTSFPTSSPTSSPTLPSFPSKVSAAATSGTTHSPSMRAAHVFEFFNRSAHEGNSEAHHMLGLIYSMGLFNIPSDEVASILHYHYAAAGGHAQSAMAIGFRHLHGVGVSKDCHRAISYYELASNLAIDVVEQEVLPSFRRPRLRRYSNGGYVDGTKMHETSNSDVVVTGSGSGSTPSDTEVMQYLRYATEQNDVAAQSMLGLIHLHGTRGQKRDVRKAYLLLRQSALEKKNANAYADLGYMVLHDIGGPYKELNGDEDEKWKWEETETEKSEQGQDTGQGQAANEKIERNKKRYALAHRYFQAAFNGGDAEGANGLGYMHLHGLGVRKSWSAAKQYYEQAAQARSIHGIYNMGAMYLHINTDAPKGDEEILPSKRDNGRKNNAGATTGAAGADDADDVDDADDADYPDDSQRHHHFDFKKALAHFRVASKAGHIQAMHKMAQMTLHSIGTEDSSSSSSSREDTKSKDTRCNEAVRLFKKVSERGPTSALLTEAEQRHAQGNIVGSLWYYAMAADLGYEVAQANAAHIYERLSIASRHRLGIVNGRTTRAASAATKKHKTSDSSFSLRLWKWAAMQSNVHANMRVGDMYFYGLQQVEIDRAKALRMYLKASGYGSAQSMFNVGWHYQYGVGVPVDFHMSKRYYDRAIETNPKEARIPALIGLGSLFFYSTWTTSSTWSVLMTTWWSLCNMWMGSQKVELFLGDVPMSQIVPLEAAAPHLGMWEPFQLISWLMKLLGLLSIVVAMHHRYGFPGI